LPLRVIHDIEGVAYHAGGGIGSEHLGANKVQDRIAGRPVISVMFRAVGTAEYAERRCRSYSGRRGGARVLWVEGELVSRSACIGWIMYDI